MWKLLPSRVVLEVNGQKICKYIGIFTIEMRGIVDAEALRKKSMAVHSKQELENGVSYVQTICRCPSCRFLKQD